LPQDLGTKKKKKKKKQKKKKKKKKKNFLFFFGQKKEPQAFFFLFVLFWKPRFGPVFPPPARDPPFFPPLPAELGIPLFRPEPPPLAPFPKKKNKFFVFLRGPRPPVLCLPPRGSWGVPPSGVRDLKILVSPGGPPLSHPLHQKFVFYGRRKKNPCFDIPFCFFCPPVFFFWAGVGSRRPPPPPPPPPPPKTKDYPALGGVVFGFSPAPRFLFFCFFFVFPPSKGVFPPPFWSLLPHFNFFFSPRLMPPQKTPVPNFAPWGSLPVNYKKWSPLPFGLGKKDLNPPAPFFCVVWPEKSLAVFPPSFRGKNPPRFFFCALCFPSPKGVPF